MRIETVFYYIQKEREYQKEKFGKDKEQSLPGFLLVLESELEEAKLGWIKDLEGRHSSLAEILQIAAVAVACLEKYGIDGNPVSTNEKL